MVQVPAVAPGHGPGQVQLELVGPVDAPVRVGRAAERQHVAPRRRGEDRPVAGVRGAVADVALEAPHVEGRRVAGRQRDGLRAREVAELVLAVAARPDRAAPEEPRVPVRERRRVRRARRRRRDPAPLRDVVEVAVGHHDAALLVACARRFGPGGRATERPEFLFRAGRRLASGRARSLSSSARRRADEGRRSRPVARAPAGEAATPAAAVALRDDDSRDRRLPRLRGPGLGLDAPPGHGRGRRAALAYELVLAVGAVRVPLELVREVFARAGLHDAPNEFHVVHDLRSREEAPVEDEAVPEHEHGPVGVPEEPPDDRLRLVGVPRPGVEGEGPVELVGHARPPGVRRLVAGGEGQDGGDAVEKAHRGRGRRRRPGSSAPRSTTQVLSTRRLASQSLESRRLVSPLVGRPAFFRSTNALPRAIVATSAPARRGRAPASSATPEFG